MNVTVDDPVFEELIDPKAELVKIGEGYQFSEGPVWNQREQALYFSDIPGDARWRWTATGGMELAATPTFKGNGLAFDVDGSLLVCEQVSSCLTRIRLDGQRELVAWHIDGIYLNSPNDVVVRSDGSIYFTDPDYGRWNDWIGCKREFVRDFKGVYRVPPGGGSVELVGGHDQLDRAATWGHAVDTFEVTHEPALAADPVVPPPVVGIGEVDAAVAGPHDHIVGAVQVLILVVVRDDLTTAVDADPHQAARHLLAHEQTAVELVRHPVALERRLGDELHPRLASPTPACVAGNVAEVHRTVTTVPHRALGELESATEELELGIGIDELGEHR